MTTRSAATAADIGALLRARNSLIWIVTSEEARAERYLIEGAASAGYTARIWDVAQGVTAPDGTVLNSLGGADPGETLAAIRAGQGCDCQGGSGGGPDGRPSSGGARGTYS